MELVRARKLNTLDDARNECERMGYSTPDELSEDSGGTVTVEKLVGLTVPDDEHQEETPPESLSDAGSCPSVSLSGDEMGTRFYFINVDVYEDADGNLWVDFEEFC